MRNPMLCRAMLQSHMNKRGHNKLFRCLIHLLSGEIDFRLRRLRMSGFPGRFPNIAEALPPKYSNLFRLHSGLSLLFPNQSRRTGTKHHRPGCRRHNPLYTGLAVAFQTVPDEPAPAVSSTEAEQLSLAGACASSWLSPARPRNRHRVATNFDMVFRGLASTQNITCR